MTATIDIVLVPSVMTRGRVKNSPFPGVESDWRFIMGV